MNKLSIIILVYEKNQIDYKLESMTIANNN